MILGLREYEEDISNTALDDFCQLSIFIESTTQNKRQGIKNGVARQDSAEIIFGGGALKKFS